MSQGNSETPQDGVVDKVKSVDRTAHKGAEPVNGVSESRRRFTKAGLLAPAGV